MLAMGTQMPLQFDSRGRLPGLVEPVLRGFYTLPEVVHYAGASRQTASRWIRGYTFRTDAGVGSAAPLVAAADADLFSFADLIEVAAIAAARRQNVSLQALRKAIDEARRQYKWERPLLSERFRHDGQEFFVKDPSSGEHVNLNRSGQVAWKLIEEVLRDLDYESELAYRWWPLGRPSGIVVDPAVSFGRPFVEQFGVSTSAIFERWSSKQESMADLSDDYGIPVDMIERALQYEQKPVLVD